MIFDTFGARLFVVSLTVCVCLCIFKTFFSVVMDTICELPVITMKNAVTPISPATHNWQTKIF